MKTVIARRTILLLPALLILANLPAVAEDWGAYAIVSASAPNLVLEATGPGLDEGAVVTVGKPSGSGNQKWVVTPKGGDFFTIRPAGRPTLVLAVARGGVKLGTPIVLEADAGQPWQEWSLRKSEGGAYCLIPRHAPGNGLDHFGGDPRPGARVDLWTHKPGDRHLEWLIRPLAGSTSSPSGLVAESTAGSYVAPEIKPEAVLKGQTKEFSFAESQIFPGTVRQVTVFIPAQYDGSKLACVYVKTDGYNAREKALMETMIATGEMPVTIGVFVRPGDLPSPVKGTIGRRNRCFEYDGMGDNNARFLVEELLPSVAARFDLKLSTSGNDRCIAGGSSGGIAAFNAAWERPDAFSRVYAVSGSFVAFRGGHEFPTLVRKFEPKPIRSFLTTGTKDMENCAGDWTLIDLEMDKALKFSGYDYAFRTINGGHGAGYFEEFQEAMSYLWKGWPAPVRAGPGAPRVRDILLPDEPWQLVGDGRVDPRGPSCNARGEVFFVEGSGDKILRIGLDGAIGEFASEAAGASGLTVAPGGDLIAVSGRTGKVTRYEASGAGTLVVDGLRGRHVLAMPDGSFYVTTNGTTGETPGEVWLVKGGTKEKVASGLKLATGLAYRADRWLLSVADGRSKWAYSYQIQPDGRLVNGERFSWLHVPDGEDDAGAESACYAREGPLMVATRFGIQACADDGPTQVILPLPDRKRAVGVCLGGRDLDTLYAFTADAIWKRKVKVHAVGAFTPWTPVRGSSL